MPLTIESKEIVITHAAMAGDGSRQSLIKPENAAVIKKKREQLLK